MKCQARIERTYKTKKADVRWPESVYGPVDVSEFPEVCNGDLIIKVRAVDEPFFGGTSARMEIESICSRCNYPWWPKRIEWEARMLDYDGWDVTDLLVR